MENIKFRYKFLICIAVALVMTVIWNVPALACTGVYVGADANDQGTSIIARSSDSGRYNMPTYLRIFGGNDGERIKKIESDNGFVYEFGDTFYRCICSPAATSTDTDSFFAFAINEFGVSISSTVTGYSSKESLNINPFVEDGLCEDVMPLIVGTQAKTAREGIELLARIIDERGSAEDNVLMISDQNECWYMEIYGGHQYCAVKAPNDCVACIGNEFAITTEYASCEDAICSPELFDLPARYNMAVYDTNGKMNIFDSYVGKGRYTDFSHLRTWGGHHLMAPSTAGTYSTTTYLPLFYKPDKKISISDVAEIFRYRYEDTEFCPDTNGREDIRVIATEEQTKTHLLQTYKNVPANICAISWLCPNCAEFGDFVPICNCQTKFDDSYLYNPPVYKLDDKSAASIIKELNAICCQNREKLGPGIRNYWKMLENYATSTLPKLIDQGNVAAINDFCSFMQTQTYEDAKRLVDEVNWYLMSQTITWQKGVDLYTLKYSDVEHPNFSCNVDAALFAKLTGWKIEENTQRQRDGVYNMDAQGVKDQANVGGTEGYLKISKDDKTVELTTKNGHARSDGKIVVDGKESTCNAILYNGRVMAPWSFLSVLCGVDPLQFKNFQLTTSNPTSAPFNFALWVLSMPLWVQITLCAICVVVLLALGFVLGRVIKKKTNK